MVRGIVFLILVAAGGATMAQQGPRATLTPAETLLEPAILRAIDEAAQPAFPPPFVIDGSNSSSGLILLHCETVEPCAATLAVGKLVTLIASKRLPLPSRSIFVTKTPMPDATTALHVGKSDSRSMRVVRSPWSTSGIADEVVEIFSTQAPYGTVAGNVSVGSFENVGQPKWDVNGIPTTSIIAAQGAAGDRQAAFVVAASAYFLATLPNAGSEALLSHLTVGAHARLAEDGRKAVAQMGNQQRASGEVLTMFAQAIEREQRRILSFERFVPGPVDPVLHERLADMAKGITGVWATMGLTPAPFVPAAERIRGRGGEDRRVPSRVRPGPLPTPDPPTAFLKFTNVADILYELGNLIDGKRSISDIRDVLSAEFGSMALPVVADYVDRLATAGAVTMK